MAEPLDTERTVMRARVLIADDNKILAEALKRLLSVNSDIVGIAVDGHELIELTFSTEPDVVVCDLSMPCLNGLDAIRALRKEGFCSKCVLLTMHADIAFAVEAFRAGAYAYVLKQGSPDEIVQAVDVVSRGGRFVSSLLKADVDYVVSQSKKGSPC
jgi:DNA-binding NarL/FixJ family response regulator